MVPEPKPKTKPLASVPLKPPAKPQKHARSLIPATPDDRVQRSLNASIHEGTLNAASHSIFTTFLTPLALALNATNFQIGLLSTAQNVMATAGQIPGAKLTAHYTRKGIWLMSQIIGKIVLWLPIILLPFLNFGDPVTVLIVVAGFSAFFLALRGPAWSSLMGDLVPQEQRGRYFGKRNLLTGLAGVAAIVLAGFVVAGVGFPLVFAAGLVLSLISIPIFLRMHEPKTERIYHYRHSITIDPRGWAVAIRLNMKLAVFTLYLTTLYFATEIVGPFYTVYMLRDLAISYEVFALLTIVGALAQIAFFRYWGAINDRYGSRSVLLIVGVLACFTPFLWLFVGNAWHILLVKIFDGFVWGGFNQVAFNYLLDVTPANKRAEYVANHNVFTGAGIIAGTFVGGIMAQNFHGASFGWLAGLQILFLLSFILRLATLALLAKVREPEVRQSEVLPVRYVMWQTMAVEPAAGIKHAVEFSFRYAFDRDAAYDRAVRRIEKEKTRAKSA